MSGTVRKSKCVAKLNQSVVIVIVSTFQIGSNKFCFLCRAIVLSVVGKDVLVRERVSQTNPSTIIIVKRFHKSVTVNNMFHIGNTKTPADIMKQSKYIRGIRILIVTVLRNFSCTKRSGSATTNP